jgi:hypothetical protein
VDEAVVALLERELGRRALLRRSASGFLLLAVASVLPSGCRGYPEPPVRLEFLTPQEYATFHAVAHAILGLGDDSVDVAVEVDRLIARMGFDVKRDIRWMLRIFEHGTHLFDLKGKRFTRLGRDDQEAYLRGWMESSLGARRIVFRALKLLAALGYYGLPTTWSAIGYDGPWVGRRSDDHRFVYEKPVLLSLDGR